MTIIVNRAETIISLETGVAPGKRISLGAEKTIYDVVLGAACEVIRRKGIQSVLRGRVVCYGAGKVPWT
jgi:hypothetical protein